jgi:signal transduction histidine kinase
MGIGLAAAFSILKSHCAHMEVRSKVGVGTQFIVRFEKAAILNEQIKLWC